MSNLAEDDELAELTGALVMTAQKLLVKQRGEFLPFAAFINPEGKVEMVGADTGVPKPGSSAVLAFLRAALASMAQQGRIKGMGICVNVGARLPGYEDKVDAICCFIDRAGQRPIDFYMPYHRRFLGFKYDKAIILPGTVNVFPTAGSQ